ncbi:MAG: hypothetical protein K0S53_987 [Bacteroidetes bacterium]|jgi:hypothetical protein|nr:hypothetical protein [Bacteroidota bacterium]MDF2453112.1 hypothetical protein [Bacteroidota bacterium]
MKQETKKIIIWTILFAIAMGFMETAVVVYLRELYYPDGFKFPLTVIPNKVAVTEFWREIATIIMLVGTGIIAGKTKLTRFAYFIMAFAIWDIFYYVFLYVLIAWPQSLLTWDILFLVPVPWVGPVLAPCLVSLEMIVFAYCIIYFKEKDSRIKVSVSQWLLLISGVLVIIMSFTTDYIEQVSQSSVDNWNIFSESQLFEELKTYTPKEFCWWLFWVGDALCALGVLSFVKTCVRDCSGNPFLRNEKKSEA